MDTAPSYIREPEKFDKVYLVGDSRTVAYHEVMKSSIPSLMLRSLQQEDRGLTGSRLQATGSFVDRPPGHISLTVK